VSAICAANSIANPTLIHVGQQLVIPAPRDGIVTARKNENTHVVQAGENLYRIAFRYGITVISLAQANGITNPTQLGVGQEIVIPGGSDDLVVVGSLPPVTGQTHVVQIGETLSGIARRYDLSIWLLARANSLTNPSLVVPGQVLVIPGSNPPTPVPTPPPSPPPSRVGSKRIVIDLSEQRLYAYRGNVLVYAFVASSGKPGSGTRTGTFSVLDKYPNAYASTWDMQMPYFMGIYWSGSLENGIHALPILSNGQTLWAGYLGTPVSFGCIILSTENARTLYYWADIGTPVEIQY
jgi:LysM repeat protein